MPLMLVRILASQMVPVIAKKFMKTPIPAFECIVTC